jgi:hypothetical protein
VELGHSERREFFCETDETVGLKTEAAVRHGLIPLIFIGETLEDRESGRAAEVLATEVRGALSKLTGDQKNAEILLAYEPVCAIGVTAFQPLRIMSTPVWRRLSPSPRKSSDAVSSDSTEGRSIPATARN